MSTAVETADLAIRFGGNRVLDGLNLSVTEGAVYGLVGPNGAGKTTTLKILMNLLRPSAGRATVLGRDSTRLGAEDFTRIGYVSESQRLPPWMTVREFLDYMKPFYPDWDDARRDVLLQRFDLPGNRKLKHLSRGMLMKAALASSLAYRPRLIVMDEPFSGLDALVRDELIEGLLENADGATVVLSSHDLAEIESFASDIGYLDGGRLLFSEEMASLRGRFREVLVCLDAPRPLPPELPRDWLRPEVAGAAVRFFDSRFDEQRTASEVRRLFGDVREISFQPMPLRSIFVALAKAPGSAKTSGKAA